MSEYEEYVCRFYPDSWGEKSITLFGVPIVRCRDCVYFDKYENDEISVCYRFDNEQPIVEPDGFCAWGEKRTNE